MAEQLHAIFYVAAITYQSPNIPMDLANLCFQNRLGNRKKYYYH